MKCFYYNSNNEEGYGTCNNPVLIYLRYMLSESWHIYHLTTLHNRVLYFFHYVEPFNTRNTYSNVGIFLSYIDLWIQRSIIISKSSIMTILLSEHQKTFRKEVIAYIRKKSESIKVLAIAWPNGAGKTTLIKGLIKKFPDIFSEVVQITTRPLIAWDRSRRFISDAQFLKEKIVLWGTAGIYQYGYTLRDLMKTIRKDKIMIFEGISRLEKLRNILTKSDLKYIIVGVIPPGKTLSSMLKKLKARLLKRPNISQIDVQKKLQDSEFRVIPEVLQKSHIIIRSRWNHSISDAMKVMKKWNEKMK